MQTFLRGMLLMTLCIWGAPGGAHAQLSLVELARSAAETVLQEAAEKAPADDADAADAAESDTTAEEPVEAAPTPLMVERYIFTPGPQPEAPPAPRPAARPVPPVNLDREILFTGVMTRDGQRRAMIREVGGRAASQEGRSRFYTEGEEIKGMTISEIGRNYLVLTGDEGEHRMNLYLADRNRPDAPPAPAPIQQPQAPTAPVDGAQPPAPADASSSPGAESAAAPASEAGESRPIFGSAARRANAEDGGAQPGVTPPHGEGASNPFLDIMRRAAERREQGGGGNPLMNAFGGGG